MAEFKQVRSPHKTLLAPGQWTGNRGRRKTMLRIEIEKLQVGMELVLGIEQVKSIANVHQTVARIRDETDRDFRVVPSLDKQTVSVMALRGSASDRPEGRLRRLNPNSRAASRTQANSGRPKSELRVKVEALRLDSVLRVSKDEVASREKLHDVIKNVRRAFGNRGFKVAAREDYYEVRRVC